MTVANNLQQIGVQWTTAGKAAWDTVYGDFAAGTAREIALLNTNHRLTTRETQDFHLKRTHAGSLSSPPRLATL